MSNSKYLRASYKDRLQASIRNQKNGLYGIYQPGFTTVKILSQKLNQSLSATYKLVSRLEQKQLIRSELVTELNLKVWVLTREGQFDLASTLRDESILKGQCRVNRISALTIAHELMLQKIHCVANEENFTEFIYGHSIQGFLLKRPDAVVKDPLGNIRAIEIERHVKSASRARVILGNYLQEVSAGKYFSIDYIAPTEARAWSLKKLFYSFNDVEIDGSTYPVTDNHRSKLAFFSQEGWPHNKVED